VFENRAMRKIFGSSREGGTGGLKKLLDVEHHNLYSSADIIRMMK
jgi:hypothetical protein